MKQDKIAIITAVLSMAVSVGSIGFSLASRQERVKVEAAQVHGFTRGHYHHRLLSRQGSSWVLSGIRMPPCPDDHKRTVQIPERDESDTLAVTCTAGK